MIWFFLIPAALLLIGIADLPIGYYSFLRVVVCIASCLIAYGSYAKEERINFGAILFGVIALIFNPVFPFYLRDKEIWTVIDIISALSFIGTSIYLRIRDKRDDNEHKRVDI